MADNQPQPQTTEQTPQNPVSTGRKASKTTSGSSGLSQKQAPTSPRSKNLFGRLGIGFIL